MEIKEVPFGTTDWSSIEATEHKGETGIAYWCTLQFGAIRCEWLIIRRGTLQITGVQKAT